MRTHMVRLSYSLLKHGGDAGPEFGSHMHNTHDQQPLYNLDQQDLVMEKFGDLSNGCSSRHL